MFLLTVIQISIFYAPLPVQAFSSVPFAHHKAASKQCHGNVILHGSSISGNSPVVNATSTTSDDLLPSIVSLKSNGPQSLKNARLEAGLSSSVLLPSIPREEKESKVNFSRDSDSTEHCVEKKKTSESTWKDRLMDVSNVASFLCVLDCTLLPLVSIAVPALSWAVGWITGVGGASVTAGSSTASLSPIMAGLNSFLSILPALGHGIALYFVIPVGLITTVVNYFFGHKEVRYALPALLGVSLIFLANNSNGVGIASVDALLDSWGVVASNHAHGACDAMSHACSEGLAHRLTNTLGCAFLLGSNYLSRKFMEERIQGCAASALAEAWGGDGGARFVCGPHCGCEQPAFGTTGSSTRLGGETLFQWEKGRIMMGRGKSDESRNPLFSFRRNGR